MSVSLSDVRTWSGVPPLSAFATRDSTPIVIDVTTGIAYFFNASNVVTPIGGGGGATSPGGSDKDVQFNNAGAFGGISPGAAGTVLTSAGPGSTPVFAASGGGITQLVNDVTAGPGAGAQSAVLDKKFYAEAWHNMYGGI